MKISIISNTTHTCPPKGWGSEIILYDFAECLIKLGHEVDLYAPIDDEFRGNFNQIDIPICNPNPQLELDLYKKYSKDLKASDAVYDMSHTKIFSDMLYNEGYKTFINIQLGFSWNVPKCKKNICVPSKNSMNAALIGLNGFENTPWYESIGHTGKLENCRYVHFGTNTDFYTPKYEKQDYFLWFGGFMPWKGTHIAIQLAKEIGFKLILASGIVEQETQKQYREYCLNEIKELPNIKYLELPDNKYHQIIKRSLIQNAKAFLSPVIYAEGFGLVNIEALSCGTPVITTNWGSLPEIIKHEETGFLCNNIDEIKTAIKNIDKIDNKNCRKDAIERFDRMIMTKNYLKLYDEILNMGVW